jgi:MFS family permease
VGNITAAVISILLGQLEQGGAFESFQLFGVAIKPWRMMFVVGTVPAFLCLFIFRRLKEPERWKAASEGALQARLGSYGELFGDPTWRRRALIGMSLAFAGVVGLWGIGFFSADLIDSVFRKQFEGQNLSKQEVDGRLGVLKGVAFIMQNLGGFFGIYTFSRVTHHLGRRPTFAVFFVLAMLSTGLVFSQLNEYHEVFWMLPVMGFCQLALFGGYAIYLPELFPTRLRSTGTSFCYNVGRLVAAVGPYTFGLLNKHVFAEHGHEAMRYSGMTMCGIFLLGLVVLPFAPETKGKPLPE